METLKAGKHPMATLDKYFEELPSHPRCGIL